jgi:hypothetical protein
VSCCFVVMLEAFNVITVQPRIRSWVVWVLLAPLIALFAFGGILVFAFTGVRSLGGRGDA